MFPSVPSRCEATLSNATFTVSERSGKPPGFQPGILPSAQTACHTAKFVIAFRLRHANTRSRMKLRLILISLIASTVLCFPAAAESLPLKLPAPQTSGGKPLMQALRDRQSRREFSTNSLPVQTLANLLWAGCGTNRLDGRRTAPSTMNAQVIDLYVATAEGVTRYDATNHVLHAVASGDLRSRTGGQDFVKAAPLALIFVADLSRLSKARPEDRERYAAIDTGCITQNLYLFCASEGLATVVHEVDRGELTALLKLKPEQRIILAQSVGLSK